MSKYKSNSNININTRNKYTNSSNTECVWEDTKRQYLNKIEHEVSTNIDNNKLNSIITGKLKFYSKYNIDKLVKYIHPVETFDLRIRKGLHVTYSTFIQCLCYSIVKTE